MPYRRTPSKFDTQTTPPLILHESPSRLSVTFPSEAQVQAVPRLTAHKPHIVLTATQGFIDCQPENNSVGCYSIAYYNPHLRTTHLLLDATTSDRILKFLAGDPLGLRQPTDSEIDQFLRTFWLLAEYTMTLVTFGAEKPHWILHLLPTVERLARLRGYHHYTNARREGIFAQYYNHLNASFPMPSWINQPPGKESKMPSNSSHEDSSAPVEATTGKPQHGGYSPDHKHLIREVTVQLNEPTAKAYRIPKPDDIVDEEAYTIPGWALKALVEFDPGAQGDWLVIDADVLGGCTRWNAMGFLNRFSVVPTPHPIPTDPSPTPGPQETPP